ncbi:hypothetical protein STW0522RAO56_23950 [Raoultella planticola]|nr:hypothetical protein STW0522RAO56_23950 [Raoultella planticola]
MTSKLTREWLKHQISAIEAVGITDSNTLSAFKLALAAMDSEPLAYIPVLYKGAELLSRSGLELIRDGVSFATDLESACMAEALLASPHPAPVVQLVPEDPPEHLLPKGNSRDATYRRGAAIQAWKQCRAAMFQAGNSPVIPEGWQVEAEKLAEMHGMSFVLFRHGEAPQCADPTKVVISFTDKGLGHDTLPAAPQEVKGE